MHFLTAVLQCRVYTKKVGHKPDFSEPVVLTNDRCAPKHSTHHDTLFEELAAECLS
jgi:ribosome-interacting GTPase 1